jgi:glycosyltransferase involved in cell wall biosynthesis
MLLRDVVVLSDTAFIDGGGAAVGLRSAIALARAGVRVTVVSAVGPPMKALLEEPNVRVLCSDQDHLGSSPVKALGQSLWNGPAARTLAAALADCDPHSTIVHVHGWTKALSSSIFHAATRLGFTVIVTLHDFFTICPNGSRYIHPAGKICTLEPMSRKCVATNCDSRNYGAKLYRVARQLVANRFSGMPGTINHFISVSDFSRLLIEPYLPENAKLYPVRNPVQAERAQRADPEGNAHFLYLGRLSPEKGPLLLARAARQANVAVAFAGEGPSAAAVTKIYPQADMRGWLDPKGVTDALRAARALVLPSLWYETYGLSVMEAAANGIPAIVPDTSASRDLVVDNETGLWFEGGNSRSLAGKLLELAQPGVAARLGAAAYARYWSDPPTMSDHVQNLLNVYESVLGEAA